MTDRHGLEKTPIVPASVETGGGRGAGRSSEHLNRFGLTTRGRARRVALARWLLLTVSLTLFGFATAPPPGCDLAAVNQALIDGEYTTAESCSRALVNDQGAAPNRQAAIDHLVRTLLAIGRGSSPEALAWAERGLALTADQPDSAVVLLARRSYGRILVELQRSQEALTVFEELLAARRAAGEPALVVESLADSADALSRAARGEEALQYIAEALALIGHQSHDELDLARLEEIQALAYRVEGNSKSARDSLERALERRRRLAPDHPETASTYSEMGELLSLEGRLLEARDTFRQVVEMLERRLGPNTPRLARALGRAAGTEAILGDLATAIALHERGLEIAMKELGPESPETGARLNDFANARLFAADFAGARKLYLAALGQANRQPEPERSLNAATMHYNLAEVALGELDYDSALKESQRALELWMATLGPDHPFVALAREGLAEVHDRRGDHDAARAQLSSALKIRRTGLGDEHPGTATVARRLGELARDRGDVAAAAAATAVAHRTLRLTTAVSPAEASRILALDAWVQLATASDPSAALANALAAEELSRDYLRQAVRYLAEPSALRLAQSRPPALDIALSILASQPLDDSRRRQVFEAVIRSRALVLGTIAARAHATATMSAHGDLREDLDNSSRRLANLLYQGPAGSLEVFALSIEAARRERDDAERELALASADFRRQVAVEDVGFAAVSAGLPPGTTLLSLVRYQHFTRDSPSAPPIPSYLAFVTYAASSAPIVIPLGTAAELDESIGEWREVARNVGGAVAFGREAELAYRRGAAALERSLWRPLTRHLKAGRVFVVGDGMTHVVSLAVLPTEPDGYLLEAGWEFHHLSAERDLLRYAELPLSSSGLLAIGAPAFAASPHEVAAVAATSLVDESLDSPDLTKKVAAFAGSHPRAAGRSIRSDCETFSRLAFEALPDSGVEVNGVANVWRQHGTGAAHVFTGASASATLFAAHARNKRVVHLATHGFFLAEDCSDSSRGTDSKRSTMENPMLLAGLALAGANRREAAGVDGDDGILTAEEISRLDLGTVEWVVLSACDTGRGHIQNGEGVLGLRHAFEVAGARSILTSLWAIDDEYAREWMAGLYAARLERRLDTVSAARSASLEVLGHLRRRGAAHPALWGAFISTGDWR